MPSDDLPRRDSTLVNIYPPVDAPEVATMAYSRIRSVLAVYPLHDQKGDVGALSYALELHNGQVGHLLFTRDGDGWTQEEPYMEVSNTRSEALVRAARAAGYFQHDMVRAWEALR